MLGLGPAELLIAIIVPALVFFACRGVLLWYWKIDRGIALLEEQNQLLTAQKDLLIKLVATQKVALYESAPTGAAAQPRG